MTEAGKDQKRRGGRPRKYASEGKRPTLTFRVRGKLYEQLQQGADAGQRSISEEIERSLERYYEQKDSYGDLARSIGSAVRAIEKTAGRPWYADDEMRLRARAAAEAVLDLLVGRRVDDEKVGKMAHQMISWAIAVMNEKRPLAEPFDIDAIGPELHQGVIWMKAYTEALTRLQDELNKRALERPGDDVSETSREAEQKVQES